MDKINKREREVGERERSGREREREKWVREREREKMVEEMLKLIFRNYEYLES